MKFDPPIFHPNGKMLQYQICPYRNAQYLEIIMTAVYPDGTVCISILHAPGDDPNSA